MNEKVKKNMQKMLQIADKIKSECDYIAELVDDLTTDDDLCSIESSFDNVERWAKEGHSVCRSTYDEFEEEE